MERIKIDNYVLGWIFAALLVFYPFVHLLFSDGPEFVLYWALVSLILLGIGVILVIGALLTGDIEIEFYIPNPFHRKKNEVSDSLLSDLGRAIDMDDEAEIIRISKQINKR